MDMNYCRRCGAALRHVRMHMYECTNRHTLFANCSPSVGVFLINSAGNVLLSRRGIDPHKGMLDSFGGFLDGEESVEDAAARELREELGIDPDDYDTLHFLCTSVGHYAYAQETLPVLSTFFWANLHPRATLNPQDDVADIVELPLGAVPIDQIHDEDVRHGIAALRKALAREAPHSDKPIKHSLDIKNKE